MGEDLVKKTANPVGDFQVITTDQLVKATMAGRRSGKSEIGPGQSVQLHFMSRVATGLINGKLAKASKDLIPAIDPVRED